MHIHSHFKSAVYQASSPWKVQSQRAHQSPPSWESSHAASAAAPHSRCFRRIRRWPAPAAVDRAHGKRRPGAPAARNGRPNAPPRSSAPDGKQTHGQQDMTGNLKPNRPNWGILTWSSVGISRVSLSHRPPRRPTTHQGWRFRVKSTPPVPGLRRLGNLAIQKDRPSCQCHHSKLGSIISRDLPCIWPTEGGENKKGRAISTDSLPLLQLQSQIPKVRRQLCFSQALGGQRRTQRGDWVIGQQGNCSVHLRGKPSDPWQVIRVSCECDNSSLETSRYGGIE